MSKTFVLKRNSSRDERTMYPTAESRSRSLSRGGYYCPYTNSEFGFDNSFKRCPVHDSPRNNFYHPYSQEFRTTDHTDMKRMKRSSSQRYSSVDCHSSKHRHRKSSPSPSGRNDLRRKMVFVLHDEIRKSPSCTVLEEISDLERITDMCMTTLKSMMESKKYRRYLHHMNNNNSQPWYSHLLCIGTVGSFDSCSG